MDLQKEWDKLKSEKFSREDTPELRLDAIRKQSRLPLQKIKQNLYYTLYFIVIFGLLFLYIVLQSNEILVQLLLGILVLAYGWAFWYNLKVYRLFKAPFDFDQDLNTSLKHVYAKIKRAIEFQERMGLYVYPISLAGGFFLGMASDGRDVDQALSEPRTLIILTVVLVIFTPLLHLFAKWLDNLMYGKYLKQLEANIRDLESTD